MFLCLTVYCLFGTNAPILCCPIYGTSKLLFIHKNVILVCFFILWTHSWKIDHVFQDQNFQEI